MREPSRFDTSETLTRASSSLDHGSEWLVERIGADGHPGTAHGHYYRFPWALAIAGRRIEAASVLTWIETQALSEAGDLRAGAPRSGFETRWASYPLANLATGAWHLERYDTAQRIARRLYAFQHQDTGGAFAGHPDHREDLRQDLFPTAQLGMTGLTTGHMDLAHGAFRWLRLVYDAQPDLPNKLYTATNEAELIVDVDGDEDLEWQVVTNFDEPRQAFYNPGIAAAFLGRYYMTTGESEALSLARNYLQLTVTGSDAQFDSSQTVQVCKFGWGASVLLDATGERQYLDHALRMARWFCDAQNDDGSWDNSPFLMERADDPESVRAEVTAEFVQHLGTIVTAVSGWGRFA